ncbi:hypothetical protein [Amycolatopsis sp.]|uniref:hypothetical protein n=1 Tax=Amycolatopsis sp. TaxID=37632 RepID=UPI002D7F4FD3|nr:hypothetical protein [Amycolatopsis sp.]HET6711733.1 hypothetical protein [Amycolatopsis sp.]
MKLRCVDLENIILDLSLQPQEKIARLSAFQREDVESCVRLGLEKSFAAGKWSLFDRYVNMAGSFPSRDYVATLVAGLDLARSEPEVYALNIVLTLSDIAAPESVPVLARTVNWRPADDEFHDLAVNAVDALLHIDTAESRQFIASLVDDDREQVRDLAQEVADDPERFW